MLPKLPKDLNQAELELLDSIVNYLNSSSEPRNLISVNLKFEGLKLNPITFRLYNNLRKHNHSCKILYSDQGAASLAKRDCSDFSDNIFSYNEFKKHLNNSIDNIIIAVAPQPYDVEEFESLCNSLNTTIIMLNGKLEDPYVGVGHVGRERRKRFNNSWIEVYYLEPLSKGALKFSYPNEWLLFKIVKDGYLFSDSFKNKPDEETIFLSL